MYRLTGELFEHLLNNGNGLGYIDPLHSHNVGADFVLEQDYRTEIADHVVGGVMRTLWHEPEVSGFWLWRKCDLKHQTLVYMTLDEGDVELGAGGVWQDTGGVILDLQKTVVILPPIGSKVIEATSVDSLAVLLKKEPGLRDYVTARQYHDSA